MYLGTKLWQGLGSCESPREANYTPLSTWLKVGIRTSALPVDFNDAIHKLGKASAIWLLRTLLLT